MSLEGHYGRDANADSPKTITVIVCTHNRCELLAIALESLAISRLPESIEWDVLVVDNNSTDGTRGVVESFRDRYPGRFSYAFEPLQGLSNARNTGIRQSRGEILAFIDDDEKVEQDWLWNLTSQVGDGRWVGAGGPIKALWPRPIPDWLAEEDLNNMGPFGTIDLGDKVQDLRRPPYGGNMAYTRKMFEKYGEFRSDLGRSVNNLQGREEIELANRLLAAREHLRYEPNAVVHHAVQAHRMEKAAVLRWWYWYGRSEVTDLGLPEARWTIFGIPLGFFRRFARWSLQSMISTSAGRRFACQKNAWYNLGSAVACFRLKRSKSSYVNPAGGETEETELPGSASIPK